MTFDLVKRHAIYRSVLLRDSIGSCFAGSDECADNFRTYAATVIAELASDYKARRMVKPRSDRTRLRTTQIILAQIRRGASAKEAGLTDPGKVSFHSSDDCLVSPDEPNSGEYSARQLSGALWGKHAYTDKKTKVVGDGDVAVYRSNVTKGITQLMGFGKQRLETAINSAHDAGWLGTASASAFRSRIKMESNAIEVIRSAVGELPNRNAAAVAVALEAMDLWEAANQLVAISPAEPKNWLLWSWLYTEPLTPWRFDLACLDLTSENGLSNRFAAHY